MLVTVVSFNLPMKLLLCYELSPNRLQHKTGMILLQLSRTDTLTFHNHANEWRET